MDQTSLIPKKSFSKPVYQYSGFGFAMSFSIVLLIVSAVLWGGTFFYNGLVQERVDVLANSLKQARAGIESSLIKEFGQTAKKIEGAKNLLSNHRTILPIFKFLEVYTLPSVSLGSFNYSVEDQFPAINMSGIAKSYSTLALQMEKYQSSNDVASVSVSDLSLGLGGTVSFNTNIKFNPQFIVFK